MLGFASFRLPFRKFQTKTRKPKEKRKKKDPLIMNLVD